MTVYADIVFVTNFISTVALLLGYSVLFNGKIKSLRIVMAGVFSGIYAVFEAVFLVPVIMRSGILFLLAVIAFGKTKLLFNTLRLAFVCVSVETVFVIAMNTIGNGAVITNGSVTVFCNSIVGGAVYLLSYPTLIFIRRCVKIRECKRAAEFVINGQKMSVELLYDSGNLLLHKGVCVAVIAWEKMSDLFCDTEYNEFLITAQDRMIYNTVGSGGILPVITPERAIIDGMEADLKIAVADRTFKGYDGVIGELNMKGIDKNAVH